ncbi:hypothetical protein GCM10027436_33190 [Actinophytocola sediminis]
MYFAGLMAVTGAVAIVGLVVDDRVLTGAPVWLKPLKFAISLGLYALTWAWLMSLQRRPRRWMWWTGTAAAVFLVVEMVAIVGQAARGELSHFNNTSAFENLVFQIMGVSVGAVWVLNLAQGVVLLRERLAERPVALAIRLGLLISLAGMAVAFFMADPTPEQRAALARGSEPDALGGHAVGVVDGGPGLPLTGWSTEAGDLRVPHFIGIHALQFLPLLAMGLAVAARRWPALRATSTRARLVVAGAIGYGGLFLITTWQAFRGQSVVAPDAWTLGALGLLAAVTVVGALRALSTRDLRDSGQLAEVAA